jgi:hypothetical protein
VVLVCFYTGNIISFLAVPKLQPAVSSAEELAYNSNLQVVVGRGSVFETVLLVPKIHYNELAIDIF